MKAKQLTASFGVFLMVAVLPVAAQGTDKHILWAVEGTEASVYLMGSIHLLTPESYPLDEVLEEVYRKSDVVAFETDPVAINSPQHYGHLMSKGIHLDGRTLADDISAETMALLTEGAGRAGISMAELMVMKPWFCSLTIYLRTLERLGLDANYGLDTHFYLKARSDGKVMRFLESADFQVDLLASLAGGDQEELLRQTLLDQGLFAGGIEGLLQAWEEGDVEWIASYVAKNMKGFPAVKDLFLDNRNRSWIAALEELLHNEHDSLVIVGAAHLAGSGSVVDLLRERGWEVRQL